MTKFRCIQPGSWPLTLGKVYLGRASRNGWIIITDDLGHERKCAAFRFVKEG